MQNHKDLDVWQQAIDLAQHTYEITKLYPKEELYGIVSQMRRSAVSVASNIAEGAARQGAKEFIQFLYIASGSASELDTQIEISKRTELANVATLEKLQARITKIQMMLHGLIRKLKQRLK
jgi:four helix bundle protein